MPSCSSNRRRALMASVSGRFPLYRQNGTTAATAATAAAVAVRGRWLKKMMAEKLKGHHARKMAKLAARIRALRSGTAKVSDTVKIGFNS